MSIPNIRHGSVNSETLKDIPKTSLSNWCGCQFVCCWLSSPEVLCFVSFACIRIKRIFTIILHGSTRVSFTAPIWKRSSLSRPYSVSQQHCYWCFIADPSTESGTYNDAIKHLVCTKNVGSSMVEQNVKRRRWLQTSADAHTYIHLSQGTRPSTLVSACARRN